MPKKPPRAPANQVARRFKQYDTDRQRWVDGTVAFEPEPARNGFKEFFTMSKLTGRIMKRLKGSEETHRVMWALLTLLEFDNFLPLTQTAIAEDLGMKPANVSRAIKRLVAVGAVILGPPTGAHKAYRLSPEWVWRGRAENHVKALEEHQMVEALDGDQEARAAMRDWNA
jgi:DNA-binding transcriptional ArsR family regulator